MKESNNFNFFVYNLLAAGVILLIVSFFSG